MEYITLTPDTIDKEHLCCAITEKKGETAVADKKQWLREAMKDGLVFYKANVRGKAFIEYLPAEAAWNPVKADHCFYINCLWVSGQYKGKGISNDLMKKCIEDAKEQDKNGIVMIAGKKKIPYLCDPKYLKYKGFVSVDSWGPYELFYLPLKETKELPHFLKNEDIAKSHPEGYTLYYTNQCPFTSKYAKILKQVLDEANIPCALIHIQDKDAARNVPAPVTNYALFKGSKYLGNEILSEKKIAALISEYAG